MASSGVSECSVTRRRQSHKIHVFSKAYVKVFVLEEIYRSVKVQSELNIQIQLWILEPRESEHHKTEEIWYYMKTGIN